MKVVPPIPDDPLQVTYIVFKLGIKEIFLGFALASPTCWKSPRWRWRVRRLRMRGRLMLAPVVVKCPCLRRMCWTVLLAFPDLAFVDGSGAESLWATLTPARSTFAGFRWRRLLLLVTERCEARESIRVLGLLRRRSNSGRSVVILGSTEVAKCSPFIQDGRRALFWQLWVGLVMLNQPPQGTHRACVDIGLRKNLTRSSAAMIIFRHCPKLRCARFGGVHTINFHASFLK